jgi:prevent-host-death family protein
MTMEREKASIAHAKDALSSLINKVAYGKVRVLLESRGKPKAALISTEDLEKLERLERGKESPDVRFQTLAQARNLRRKILRRHKKTLSDSAKLLDRLRKERDRELSGMR